MTPNLKSQCEHSCSEMYVRFLKTVAVVQKLSAVSIQGLHERKWRSFPMSKYCQNKY